MLIKANKVENRMKSDWILIILSIIVGIVLTLIVVFSGIELNRRYKEKDCMKNKTEVGEYVRTDKGNIGKIVEIRLGFNKDTQLYQDIYILDNGLWTVLDYIVKHSEQLIDLIEVGDFVNGYRVENVINERHCPSGKCVDIDSSKDSSECTLWEEDIQTILTKEQMEANCYKVGGERKCM